MSLLAGFFFVGLYKATEKIFDKMFDAAWEPVDESLKARFKRWAGKGKEKEREAAFSQAAEFARQRVLNDAPDQKQAEAIFNALNAAENERVAAALADFGSQTLLIGGRPDTDKLESAVSNALTWDFYSNRAAQPSAEQVAQVVADFLHHLHDALLDQEIFYSLRDAEMIKILRRIEAQGEPATPYASEAEYRAQVIEVDGRLDFTGMAVGGRREAVRVDRMFAHLQLKPESSARKEPLSPLEDEQLPSGKLARLKVLTERFMQPLIQPTPSMAAAMQERKPVVILGDPGSGKSTLLKYLAVLAADGQPAPKFGLEIPAAGPPLPIFIPLRRFASEAEGSLSDYFEEQTRERYDLNLPPGFIKQALRAGRCLVLLDGLDEVWERGKRGEVRDAVHALVTHPQYRHNQFIITSRISGYNAAPLDNGLYPHYEVQPLADEDIRTFVQTWYQLREPDARQRKTLTKGLIEALDNQANMQELARNPLILTIIALVHRNEADLPQERATLYQKCVQTLIDEWEGRKKLTMAEKSRPFYVYREDLLEMLAYDLHAGAEQPRQLQAIAREPLESKLADFMVDPLELFANRRQAWPEAETLVRFIADRVGLLVARGQDDFSFAHLTFQEYLAARDIYHRTQGDLEAAWDEIKGRLYDAHWREVILLLLALLGKEGRGRPSTTLIERLLAAGEADPFEEVLHHHLYLAAQAVADKVNMAAMVKEKIVNRLFQMIKERPSWEQGGAFNALGQLEGDQQAAAGLLRLASDLQVDAGVRRDAAQALGQLG
ncbi:MAG: NACHT domain-containing protein, partial [Anaerolineales bacterium]|nr:NACHT domain-containing protein [Anaerolineales bacterium]